MDFEFLSQTFLNLLHGIPVTLELATLSLVLGACLALAFAVIRVRRIRPLNWLVIGYVYVFRGTPLLVQLFIIYYGLAQFPEIRSSFAWTYLREPYWCALLALTLNTAAYGSEILRGALLSVPRGQIMAARACGMSGLLLFRRISFPIALRQALPAYGNEFILMIKATSLASLVTLADVTGIAARIIAETYRPVEVFVAAGTIYLALSYGLILLVRLAEIRLNPDQREPAPGAGVSAARKEVNP